MAPLMSGSTSAPQRSQDILIAILHLPFFSVGIRNCQASTVCLLPNDPTERTPERRQRAVLEWNLELVPPGDLVDEFFVTVARGECPILGRFLGPATHRRT